MSKTSIFSDSQINEGRSRIFIDAFALDKGWKFRGTTNDNDIDGSIEHFARDPSTRKMHTTAKFIQLQLKSSNDKFSGVDNIKYACPVKLLHFADLCEIPIVLVLYSVPEKRGYCLFLQEYIYETLNQKSPNWRNNSDNVTIEVPAKDFISTIEDNFKFEDIFESGIKTIAQLRKISSNWNYYEIYKLEDNSTGTVRRADAKIIVHGSIADSRGAIRLLIPKINEEIRHQIYHRTKIQEETFGNRSCDVVWLSLFNSLSQAIHGIQICRTQWINSELPQSQRPMESQADEVVSGIRVQWNDSEEYDQIIQESIVSKGEFVMFADSLFESFFKVFSKAQHSLSLFQKNSMTFKEFRLSMIALLPELAALEKQSELKGFPPLDCKDANSKLIGAVGMLDNIKFVINDTGRSESNVLSCIKTYVEVAEKDAKAYEYEREKLR